MERPVLLESWLASLVVFALLWHLGSGLFPPLDQVLPEALGLGLLLLCFFLLPRSMDDAHYIATGGTGIKAPRQRVRSRKVGQEIGHRAHRTFCDRAGHGLAVIISVMFKPRRRMGGMLA